MCYIHAVLTEQTSLFVQTKNPWGHLYSFKEEILSFLSPLTSTTHTETHTHCCSLASTLFFLGASEQREATDTKDTVGGQKNGVGPR